MNKVSTNDCKPNDIWLVRGKVTFSHITKQYTGDELKQINSSRARVNPRMPTFNKPYTSITIKEARVIRANREHPTVAEQYGEGALYMSEMHRDWGNQYTGYNNGNTLPKVYQRVEGQKEAVELPNKQELANGLDVTLVMRIFKSTPNNGKTLDAIIINEPVRYYEQNPTDAYLESLGIKVTKLDATETVEVPNETGTIEVPNESPAVPDEPPVDVSRPETEAQAYSTSYDDAYPANLDPFGDN